MKKKKKKVMPWKNQVFDVYKAFWWDYIVLKSFQRLSLEMYYLLLIYPISVHKCLKFDHWRQKKKRVKKFKKFKLHPFPFLKVVKFIFVKEPAYNLLDHPAKKTFREVGIESDSQVCNIKITYVI